AGEGGGVRVLAAGDGALARRPGPDPRAGSGLDRRGVDALQAHGLLDVAVALLEVDRHRLVAQPCVLADRDAGVRGQRAALAEDRAGADAHGPAAHEDPAACADRAARAELQARAAR